MAKKNEKVQEASTVASIKGFSAPFGSVPSKKKKGKKNPSKPYGDAELFESAVAQALLNNESVGEVVRKRGNQWVLFDDDTDTEKGVYMDRDTAWEKQRQYRRARSVERKTRKAERERQEKALTPTLAAKPTLEKEPQVAKKARPEKKKMKLRVKRAKQPKRVSPSKRYRQENVSTWLKSMLSEGSMISYMFENTPVSKESAIWDTFASKISKQTAMSDTKFKKIVQDIAKSEAKMLGSAVVAIDQVLRAAGSFEVQKGKADQDPETGNVRLMFVVRMKENKQKLKFAVTLQNGKPLILFPEESRTVLNDLADSESKLLRAELMHAQETVLDEMEDVVNVTKKRDIYLKKVQDKVDKFLNSISPLELSMAKFLIKNKYKGIR